MAYKYTKGDLTITFLDRDALIDAATKTLKEENYCFDEIEIGSCLVYG